MHGLLCMQVVMHCGAVPRHATVLCCCVSCAAVLCTVLCAVCCVAIIAMPRAVLLLYMHMLLCYWCTCCVCCVVRCCTYILRWCIYMAVATQHTAVQHGSTVHSTAAQLTQHYNTMACHGTAPQYITTYACTTQPAPMHMQHSTTCICTPVHQQHVFTRTASSNRSSTAAEQHHMHSSCSA